MELTVVILAAGQSKRMNTALSKVLHPLAGTSLLERVIKTAQSLNPKDIYVVYGNGDQVKESLQHYPIKWIKQEKQLGTGHAVLQALPSIDDQQRVLILYGDVPLISKETLTKLIHDAPQNSLGILIVNRVNPFGYGRIIKDNQNNIIAIVEQKDATTEQLKITQINTGFLTASAKQLKKWLSKIKNDNAQQEYYLTDIVTLAAKEQCPIVGINANSEIEVQGINDRIELAKVERYCQMQIAQQLMLSGVTIVDPARLDVRGEIKTGRDILIDINVVLEGNIQIDDNSMIGSNVYLKNVKIGKNVIIKPNCVIEDAVINDGCQIGPFARIRPGTQLAKNVHIGNFVELKNSQVDENTKASHLSYLGDAIIGKNVNIGCGTITCNYDGANKYQTIIKDGAFIGSDSQLIAPITIGENAYIGSGSTVAKDAPAGKLTIARAKQVTIENWKPPKKDKKE